MFCKYVYMYWWTRNLYLFLMGNFDRHDQDQEVQSKIATIEDLHSRLKLNIDNIQQLNQQVWNFYFGECKLLNSILPPTLHARIIFWIAILGILTPKFSLAFSIICTCCFDIFQLSNLQKENHRLRNDLDREISSRQTMELQVESKEQTISSLKSQLEAKRHLLIENSSPLKDFDKPVSPHCSSSNHFHLSYCMNEMNENFILRAYFQNDHMSAH